MAIQIRTTLDEPETGVSFIPTARRAPKGRRRQALRTRHRIYRQRRPARSDQGADGGRSRRRQGSGAAGCHRIGQDLHHGQSHRGVAAPRPHPRAQQDPGGAAIREFKNFFPNNAVEYFVSYYDYYQPEAYVPRSDTYIEKESSINESIDRMRHSATRALLERDDVIIVASVSCLYGIGSVETYSAMIFDLKRARASTSARSSASSSRCNTSATTPPSCAAISRTRRQSGNLPSHYEDSAWRVSFSAMRSRRSSSSIP